MKKILFILLAVIVEFNINGSRIIIIMDGTKIGKNCIIGAGSLVTEGTVVPDGKMFFGRPARYVRDLTPEEIENNREIAEGYVRLKDEWMGRKSD